MKSPGAQLLGWVGSCWFLTYYFRTRKRKWGGFVKSLKRDCMSRGDETCVTTTILSPQEWERITNVSLLVIFMVGGFLWSLTSLKKSLIKPKRKNKSLTKEYRDEKQLQLGRSRNSVEPEVTQEEKRERQDFSMSLEDVAFVGRLPPLGKSSKWCQESQVKEEPAPPSARVVLDKSRRLGILGFYF